MFMVIISIDNFIQYVVFVVVKNPPTDAGDLGSIPGSGRSPGEGNGNPLHVGENTEDLLPMVI